jgi:hypothetical protein
MATRRAMRLATAFGMGFDEVRRVDAPFVVLDSSADRRGSNGKGLR